MSFQELGLHADLLKSLVQLGYHEPTPIQQHAIPHALAGRDLIGCAQTGTGKTAAFTLPIIQKLHSSKSRKTKALILTPTRELAMQIGQVVHGFAANTALTTASIYGGISMQPQINALRRGTDIVVATPGRLLDHINSGAARFDALEFLVLDEADRMLDMGFLPDVRRILERIPHDRQTMMFSATMSKEIQKLSKQILIKPAIAQIGRQATPAEGVKQSIYSVAQNQKTDLLMTLLNSVEMESVLIFMRTKMRANRLARQLKQRGLEVGLIHGDRTQNQRQAALAGFRTRRFRVLVATDVAARGIDIDGISHVVNFDVPVSPTDYVHRIGRTARAKAVGEALTLVSDAEEGSLEAIQRLVKTKIERKPLPEIELGKNDFTSEIQARREQKWFGRKSSQSFRHAAKKSNHRRRKSARLSA